jgi:hypothetical protein
MDIQKIIDKVETRKKVTKQYKDDLKKIFDWITALNIDVDMNSKNIRATYEIYNGNGENTQMDSSVETGRDVNFVIGIKAGECALYTIYYYGGDVEKWKKQKECDGDIGYYISYFNIEDMNAAIFSILTQLENIGTREEKAKEIRKIVEAITK